MAKYTKTAVEIDPVDVLRREFRGFNDILNGEHPPVPMQVEIHPHYQTIMCNNDCGGCTGGYYRKLLGEREVGIKPDRLIKTIDDFTGSGIYRVAFSGNCIEPLLYPAVVDAVHHIREAGLQFSLYSNFYFGDREGLIRELTSPSFDDYVRISLDAGNSQSYYKIHHPQDKHAYEKILENIEALLSSKLANSSPVFVDVTYLLSNHNSDLAELKDIVGWVSQHQGINRLRFTVYQKPLGRPMGHELVIPEKNLLEINRLLSALKGNVDRKDFEIFLPDNELSTVEREKTFNRCFVQEVYAVIGFDGEVYPCTAMAYADSPPEYRFGNINEKDFWDIWRGDERLSRLLFPLNNCYDCTRSEFKVNQGFHRLMENKT